MSGGSLDYIYFKVESAAYDIAKESFTNKIPELKAFKDHLVKVAEVLHDVEWFLSGDYAEETMVESIKKLLSEEQVLDSVVKEAEEISIKLKNQLESYHKSKLKGDK
jgi:glutaminase